MAEESRSLLDKLKKRKSEEEACDDDDDDEGMQDESQNTTDLVQRLEEAKQLLIILAQENVRQAKLIEFYQEKDTSLDCDEEAGLSQTQEDPGEEAACVDKADGLDLSQAGSTTSTEIIDLDDEKTWENLYDWLERVEKDERRRGGGGDGGGSKVDGPASMMLRSSLSRTGSLRGPGAAAGAGAGRPRTLERKVGGSRAPSRTSSLGRYEGRPPLAARPAAGSSGGNDARGAATSGGLPRAPSLQLPLTPQRLSQSSQEEEKEEEGGAALAPAAVPPTARGAAPLVLPPQERLCRHPASLVPRVGVAVIVSSQGYPGCVLVGRRKGSHGAGTWQLPGGHLEYGEDLAHCARREVAEETGLAVEPLPAPRANANAGAGGGAALVCFVAHSVAMEGAPGRAEKLHYVTLFVRARQVNCEELPFVKEPDKCEEWKWVHWSVLKKEAASSPQIECSDVDACDTVADAIMDSLASTSTVLGDGKKEGSENGKEIQGMVFFEPLEQILLSSYHPVLPKETLDC